MAPETIGWDLRNLSVEPSTGFKVYMLFLLVVCVVAAIHLVKVLRACLHLPLLRQEDSSVARLKLTASGTSFRLWMGCTWLVWGIFMCANVHTLCDRMLDETHVGIGVFLLIIRDYTTNLSMTLAVISLLYLVHWGALKGIERLRT